MVSLKKEIITDAMPEQVEIIPQREASPTLAKSVSTAAAALQKPTAEAQLEQLKKDNEIMWNVITWCAFVVFALLMGLCYTLCLLLPNLKPLFIALEAIFGSLSIGVLITKLLPPFI